MLFKNRSHCRLGQVLRSLVLILVFVHKNKHANKIAVSLNHNILFLLTQSRLRENPRIKQNRQRNSQRRRRLVSSLVFMLLFHLRHLPVRRIWLKPGRRYFGKRLAKIGKKRTGMRIFPCLKQHLIAFADNFRHISLKGTLITGKPLQCVIESP